jgi:hypothetical protein
MQKEEAYMQSKNGHDPRIGRSLKKDIVTAV